MKTDLRDFSDQELSLQVYNTESLYKMRHNWGFLKLIEEYFDYTSEQLMVLLEDLEEDRKENE